MTIMAWAWPWHYHVLVLYCIVLGVVLPSMLRSFVFYGEVIVALHVPCYDTYESH